jgi:hypothetical protein
MRIEFGTAPAAAIVQKRDNRRSLEHEDGCDK